MFDFFMLMENLKTVSGTLEFLIAQPLSQPLFIWPCHLIRERGAIPHKLVKQHDIVHGLLISLNTCILGLFMP